MYKRQLLLLPVILLAWALYLHNLEAKSLWFDELGTLTCAAWDGTWADAMRRSLTDLALPKPPLYFLLTRLFLALGGRVLFLRLPAALWATLTIPLVYALAGRLLNGAAGRGAGLLAALLLALFSVLGPSASLRWERRRNGPQVPAEPAIQSPSGDATVDDAHHVDAGRPDDALAP